MKELGPLGGARAGCAPLDPPMIGFNSIASKEVYTVALILKTCTEWDLGDFHFLFHFVLK